jgi:hypothetical protein
MKPEISIAGRRSQARKDIAERLRIARIRLGISEQEAAAAAEVCVRTWKKYEGGGHMTMPIVNFGLHFGLGLDWLFCGIGCPPACRRPRLTLAA